MASYLRPRRGKRATARTTLSGTNVLKKGEIFFECDNGPGGGQGRIMMGDGSSNYSALTTKYFLDFDSAKVAFTNVTASNSSSAATPIGTILPTNTLATCLNGIKQSLLNLQGAVTALNNDLNVPIQSKFIDVTSTYYLNFWRTGTKVFYSYIGMIRNYTKGSDNILVQNINLPAAFVPASYNSARGACNLYANNEPIAMGTYIIDLKTSGGKFHVYTSATGSIAQIDIFGMYYIL